MPSEWVDISVPLHQGMVRWPDNPPVRIERMLDLERGDACTVSTLSCGSHTGTHVDAPGHFIRGGGGIDAMPLAATVGRARVIAIRHPASITTEELQTHRIRRGERIVFKTKNSSRCWKTTAFVEDFVYLSTDAARFLAAQGVRTVGVDYLSVGGYRANNGVEVHRALLQAGIWIIEGLNLSGVSPGTYHLLCLPLKIRGGDGAPARAFLRVTRRRRQTAKRKE